MSRSYYYAICGLIVYAPHATKTIALIFAAGYFLAALYFAWKDQ